MGRADRINVFICFTPIKISIFITTAREECFQCCLFRLSEELRKNYWFDCYETWGKGEAGAKEEHVKFWSG